jgi:hypothetical protein
MESNAMESDGDWMRHLERMTVFAEQRRQHIGELTELAKKHCYIRIGGNGFRLVSIHRDNPCGSLYIDGKEVGTTPTLSVVLDKAQFASQRVGSPGNGKTEHRVQAYLIQQALTRPEEFPGLLDCDDLFDELLFITDEFRLGEIRADVIALGRKGESYVPVYIELKATRSLTRVIDQLDNITNRMTTASNAAVALLAAASGIGAELIEMNPRRLLIWPASASGRESASVSNARDKGFVTIGYTKPSEFEFGFQRER